LLPLVGVAIPYLSAIVYAALAVALIILALGAVNSTLAKISLLIGGIGFAILALPGFGIALPAALLSVAQIMAALGFLVGAIVLYVGREVSNAGALALVVSAILAAIILLGAVASLGLGAFVTVLTIVFGAALVVAGYLFRQTERRN
jgi:hypothetical protein